MAKRKKKKRTMPVVRIGEVPTPERCRQLGGVMTEVVERDAGGKAYMKRHRVYLECILDFYFRQHHISDPQYTAGLKFREIYLSTTYGYTFKLLCNPFLMDVGQQANAEGRMLARINCMRLLEEAMNLLTPEEQTIVRNVCGYDDYAGGRKNKRILLRALDKLAKFWGYV